MKNVVAQIWVAVVEALKWGQSLAIFRMHVTEVAKLPSEAVAPVYLPTNK